jgi:Domain of unknown function (DUF4105)
MRARAVAAVAVVFAVLGAARVASAQPRPFHKAGLQRGPIEDQPPFIDLITIEIGPVIFEKFGHASLCLRYHDPIAHPTKCFNYGVTDFSGGAGLIWGFLRSKQDFWVEVEPESELVRFYGSPLHGGEDRTIWRQTLPLTPAQARAIEAKLWQDIDLHYKYDHFFDNCTTRLRDIIDQVTDGKLRRGADADYPLTFREIGMRGLAEFPPIIAIGDFTVGRTLDRKPTMWEAMFHPDVLRDEVAKKLGAVPVAIWTRHARPFPTSGPTDRGWALLIGLAFFVPLGVAIAARRLVRPALVIAVIPLSLMGLLIWTVSFVSSIPGLRWNEAFFLFVPFDFLLVVWKGTRRRRYAEIRAGMVVWVSLLRAFGIFRQPLWVPIVVAFVPHALIAWVEPLLAPARRDQPARTAALAASSPAAVVAAADAADVEAEAEAEPS